MRERFLSMYPLGAFTVYHAARDERKITLRAHTSVVLLYLCCWRCGGTLFRCIVRVCLRVMHTVYVEPVRCWSYILEKPFRYFVRLPLPTACHASWRQRGTWNRFLDGPWNGPKIWWPFHCPSIVLCIYSAIVSMYYCFFDATSLLGIRRQARAHFSYARAPRRFTLSFFIRLLFHFLVPPVLYSQAILIQYVLNTIV